MQIFHQNISTIANMVGLVGVFLTLLAYGLLQLNRISSYKITYSVLNLIGSIFILFSLYFAWNLSAAIMEIAWILISLLGVYKAVIKHMKMKIPKEII